VTDVWGGSGADTFVCSTLNEWDLDFNHDYNPSEGDVIKNEEMCDEIQYDR
jgi:hypothetical protein